MSPRAGTYELGPDNATLWVETRRQGAAAKVGHDLTIEVTAWEATLELDEDSMPSGLRVKADARSLRVREGSGGVQPLGDDDKAEIEKTIDEQVLKGAAIEFRSSEVDPREGGRSRVSGELELAGVSHPVELELTIGQDEKVAGATTVRQTDWRIKPYSALFGALKVADEVEVRVEGQLSPG